MVCVCARAVDVNRDVCGSPKHQLTMAVACPARTWHHQPTHKVVQHSFSVRGIIRLTHTWGTYWGMEYAGPSCHDPHGPRTRIRLTHNQSAPACARTPRSGPARTTPAAPPTPPRRPLRSPAGRGRRGRPTALDRARTPTRPRPVSGALPLSSSVVYMYVYMYVYNMHVYMHVYGIYTEYIPGPALAQ